MASRWDLSVVFLKINLCVNPRDAISILVSSRLRTSELVLKLETPNKESRIRAGLGKKQNTVYSLTLGGSYNSSRIIIKPPECGWLLKPEYWGCSLRPIRGWVWVVLVVIENLHNLILCSHTFVSKWLVETTLFEISPVFRESAATSSC